MKKFLMALLLMAPVSAYALSVGVEHDVSIEAGGATIGYDQDGSKFSVGTQGITFSNSDTVDFGVEYSTSLLGDLEGSVSYDYTTDSDHVLGLGTSVEYFGVGLDADFGWNVSDSEVTGEIGTGYSLLGVDGSLTSNWDIDDFSYEGLDIDAGYTWAITDTFSVRPNVTVPFDEDFTRGDLTAGISISLSFGSSSTE